jgi:hypothetical protein
MPSSLVIATDRAWQFPTSSELEGYKERKKGRASRAVVIPTITTMAQSSGRGARRRHTTHGAARTTLRSQAPEPVIKTSAPITAIPTDAG